MRKESMAVWLPDDIRAKMQDQGWFIDLIAEKTPPNVTQKDLKGLDPETILTMPKIYQRDPKYIINYNGKEYLVIDPKAKTTISLLDLETGAFEKLPRRDENKNDLFEDILKNAFEPKRVETQERLNEQIATHNAKVDSIDKATSNLTLIPLQLAALNSRIDERVETIDDIVLAIQTKLDAMDTSVLEEWQEGIKEQLLTGELDEITFVDTALFHYQGRYNELVEDLKSGSLPIPPSIDNPEELKQKLISLGELSFNSYLDHIAKLKQRQEAPGQEFDVSEVDVGPIQEVALGDVPKKEKATGHKSVQNIAKSSEIAIRGMQEDKSTLLGIKQATERAIKNLADLEKGQRSNAYILSTPEGQQIIKELRDYANQDLAGFVTRYKSKNVGKEGKIDPKKLGRSGTLGNAALIIAFSKIYQVLSGLLNRLTSPEALEQEIEDLDVERTPVEASSVDVKKLSSYMWESFEKSMTPRRGL